MTMINLSLPHSLHKQAIELAKMDGISMDQFIAQALAEKVAFLIASDYFLTRAKRGNLEKFEQALAKIPERAPEEYDKL
jgi:hypothetical protein